MDIQEKGKGPLFTDPDPDAARAFFMKKSRNKTDKRMTLKQAVETFVQDGNYLGIGGFGANRTPVAVCHEIVRQRKKNLGFAGHTATHDMQILSAGKVFNRIDMAYGIGLEARGLSKSARQYMESGQVEVCEWTNYALSLRLQAAAMGVPFLPIRSMLGTQTFEHSGAVNVYCPFTGKKIVLVPALSPDVSFIHVHEADIYGNGLFEGIAVADIELAHASKRLILTCERLVSHRAMTRKPHRTDIPYFIVDAVCEVPFGAYPGTMPYEYFSDEVHLKDWLDAENDPEKLAVFLQKNIYGCEDFSDYIQVNGGMKRLQELRHLELLIKSEIKDK